MTALDVVEAVLEAAGWPPGGTLHAQRAALVDVAQCAALLEDFKLGPIFPLAASRPPRIALSNQGEVTRWRSAVLAAFPHPKLERFLDSVPASARRMIDSDGATAIVYLDDLQDLEGGARDAEGRPLMFLTLDTRSGRLGAGTRHEAPPRALLDGVLAQRLAQLEAAGAVGLWSVRFEAKRPVGVVWVSESRWRKNPEVAIGVLNRIGTHPGIDASARAAQAAGYLAYPDAIEARADGSWDVTLGFVRAAEGPSAEG